MSSTLAYTEIKNHLATALSPLSVLNFDDIEPAQQQGTDPFLVLEEIGGTELLTSFGDPSSLGHREDGSINIYCFTPAPESIDAARLMAENAATVLRLQILNGVRIRSVTPPEVDSSNDGLWTIGSFIVTFDLHTYYATP